MPTILLIRHGVNDFVGKRLAGHLPNVHLNEKGRKQAGMIVDALKKAPIKAIYSSPLERAMETAAPLSEALNLPVISHPGLIEIDFGAWQGKTMKQMQRLKLWKTVQEKPSEMRFPGGESFVEAQQRLVAAIDGIAAGCEEKDLVACFSHSDAIRLIVAHYLGMPLDTFQRIGIDPGSITTLHLGEGHPFVGNMNLVLGFQWEEPPAKKNGKKKDAAE